MQISVAGTDIGFESTASPQKITSGGRRGKATSPLHRVEIFIAWRPINHYLQTGKPPSHSVPPATPDSFTSSSV
jgi:hypothetical protein